MSVKIPQVAEILQRAQIIDDFQIRSALAEHAKWGGRFTKVVSDLRFASEPRVVAALGQALKLSSVDFSQVSKDAAALSKLEADFCEASGVFPCALKDQGKTLWLAMCDPTDYATVEEVERKTRCRLQLLVAGESALKAALQRCYRDGRRQGEPASQASIELSDAPATTGEFLDQGGQVLGKMKHVERPARPAPAPNPQDSLAAIFDFDPQVLTPEQQQRLEAVKANQERGSLILRTLLELCVEKGVISAADVNKLPF